MKGLLLGLFFSAVAITSVAGAAPAVDGVSSSSVRLFPERAFRIGIISLSDNEHVEDIVSETVTRLRKNFAPYVIDFREYTSRELERAVKKGEVDAFIASSGFYWRMMQYGARDIATLISAGRPDPNKTSAILYLARADDRRYRTIADMKGARLSASYPTAFMGYRIGLAQIAAEGFDPENFFSSASFTESPGIEGIVQKLLEGKADVAFVQACWLERQSQALQKRLRAVAPIEDPTYPCAHSTDKYPNITVALLRGAPPGSSREIARILLTMPATADGQRWGLATDFQSVDRVYRLLKLEQYAYLREWSVTRWISAHRPWIAAAVFCLLLLVMHSFVVGMLVRRRTEELAAVMREKEIAQERLQSLYARMEKVRKASLVSQLSSMIAHELAQPIGAARSFCEGLKLLIENRSLTPEKLVFSVRGIERGLARVSGIVDKVRSYNKGKVNRDEALNLAGILRTSADSLSQDLRKQKIEFDVPAELTIIADRLEAELLFNNLIANAVAAARADALPRVSVSATLESSNVLVRVVNNGRRLTDDDLVQLTVPFISEKGEGHGLGIPISLSLAEANGGHLEFVAREEGGIEARVRLRVAS